MDVDSIGGIRCDVCLAIVTSAIFLHQAKVDIRDRYHIANFVSGGICIVSAHSMALVVPA